MWVQTTYPVGRKCNGIRGERHGIGRKDNAVGGECDGVIGGNCYGAKCADCKYLMAGLERLIRTMLVDIG